MATAAKRERDEAGPKEEEAPNKVAKTPVLEPEHAKALQKMPGNKDFIRDLVLHVSSFKGSDDVGAVSGHPAEEVVEKLTGLMRARTFAEIHAFLKTYFALKGWPEPANDHAPRLVGSVRHNQCNVCLCLCCVRV
jgi:hypothetical protein